MHSASVGFHCPECLQSGGQKVLRAADLGPNLKLVYGMMAALAVTYLAQTASGSGNWRVGEVTERGILFGPLVNHGEYWRIVTGGFLHAGLLHLAFNMYALYIFGPALQREIGMAKTALVYVGGLFGGSAAVLLFNFDTPTLGASGAVLGLAGGLAVALLARGIKITQTSLAGIFLINLALPIFVNISFWGHLGGMLGGALVAGVLLFGPKRLGLTQPQAMSGAVAAIVLFAGLGVLGASLALSPIF